MSRDEALRRAVVGILDRGLSVVGTGFFVKRDLVATCAHVVNAALQDGDLVEIQMGVSTLPATVDRATFRDVEDVAFLRVQPLPDSIQPLALATSEGTEKRALRGFGFPKVGRKGLWMTATVVGPLDGEAGRRLQLRSTNISPGCSGAPLWNDRGHVVGMAVAIVDQEARTGRHADTAMAIAAEVIAGVGPGITLEPTDHQSVPGAPSRGWRRFGAWAGAGAIVLLLVVMWVATWLVAPAPAPRALAPTSANLPPPYVPTNIPTPSVGASEHAAVPPLATTKASPTTTPPSSQCDVCKEDHELVRGASHSAGRLVTRESYGWLYKKYPYCSGIRIHDDC